MSVTVRPRRGARAVGIARSLLTYYGPAWRRRRITRFYAQFLAPGDLAFDIGAHVGNRIRTFRRLGARVVAVEPQPDFTAVLRLLYGRDASVALERCGVGAQPGRLELRLSTRTPTVSTFAESWIDDVQADTRLPAGALGRLRTGSADHAGRTDRPARGTPVLQDRRRGLRTGGAARPQPSRSRRARSSTFPSPWTARSPAWNGFPPWVTTASGIRGWKPIAGPVGTGWNASAMIDLLTALPITDRSGDVYAVRLDRLQKIRRAEPRSANTVSPVASSTPSLSVTR